MGHCTIYPVKSFLLEEEISRNVPGSRWVVWCDIHSCYMEARNMEEARWMADNPDEFCSGCQEDRDGAVLGWNKRSYTYDQRYEAVGHFNEQLRNVRSWEDFQKLNADMDATGLGLCFSKRGKNRGVFSITPKTRPYFQGNFEERPDRATYLVDDGISSGECNWENLWRSIEVRL